MIVSASGAALLHLLTLVLHTSPLHEQLEICTRCTRWKVSRSETLPSASVVIDDQSTGVRLARWDTIADQYDARKTALDQKGRLDTVYKPAPPELLYLDDFAW